MGARPELRLQLFPSLRGYERTWFRADLMAGLAAGAVVVPQAMAYATIADMPVEVGLYTCIVPMAVYVMLGGSRPLSVSTTSTVATLCAATLVGAGVAVGSPAALADLATLVFLTGLVLLAARLLHLGALVENLSEAVLIGVKGGVGLTVAAGQLPKLLGLTPGPEVEGFFSELAFTFSHLADVNSATLWLSVGTIAVLLLLRHRPRVPAPLVAVVGGIVLAQALDLEDRGVTLVPEVPRGLPLPELPAFDRIGALLPGAIAIALMVFLETVAVARTVRRPNDPPLDNGQELVAVGSASVAGAFFQSLPAAGGFSQTAINLGAGARTQLSELVTVGLAVLVAVVLAPVFSDLPEATLAAMVIVAVLGLVDLRDFARLWRINPVELAVALTTAVLGLTGGMLTAVAVGVALTLLLVLHELNHPVVVEVHPGPPGAPPVPGLLVLRVITPLYTANIRAAQQTIVSRVENAEAVRVVVVEATSQGRLSVTALDGLKEMANQLANGGVTLWVASLPDTALATARRTRWWPDWEERGLVFPSAEAAVQAFGNGDRS